MSRESSKKIVGEILFKSKGNDVMATNGKTNYCGLSPDGLPLSTATASQTALGLAQSSPAVDHCSVVRP